jgi:hypothetical protein
MPDTHIHTRARMILCMHVCMHACTHWHACVCVNVCMCVCLGVQDVQHDTSGTLAHAHTHTPHAHAHANAHARSHVCVSFGQGHNGRLQGTEVHFGSIYTCTFTQKCGGKKNSGAKTFPTSIKQTFTSTERSAASSASGVVASAT